ncbi:MAG TPA: hypothetical protein VGQ11_08260 [Candidatus Acidoferrales bacterium]|jgi:hypothetical protein|nr:hypothetical protein [Candidatus Acidoferrales bacterium]
MRLFGPTGDSFDLEIIGYEFPAEICDLFDSNWLQIQTEVSVGEHVWRGIDPSLLTWEIVELANWLERVADGRPTSPAAEFMEPELRFQLVDRENQTIRLQVCALLAERQLGPAMPRPHKEERCVELECTSEQLVAAAGDLRRQLGLYPPRGDVGLYMPGQKRLQKMWYWVTVRVHVWWLNWKIRRRALK